MCDENAVKSFKNYAGKKLAVKERKKKESFVFIILIWDGNKHLYIYNNSNFPFLSKRHTKWAKKIPKSQNEEKWKKKVASKKRQQLITSVCRATMESIFSLFWYHWRPSQQRTLFPTAKHIHSLIFTILFIHSGCARLLVSLRNTKNTQNLVRTHISAAFYFISAENREEKQEKNNKVNHMDAVWNEALCVSLSLICIHVLFRQTRIYKAFWIKNCVHGIEHFNGTKQTDNRGSKIHTICVCETKTKIHKRTMQNAPSHCKTQHESIKSKTKSQMKRTLSVWTTAFCGILTMSFAGSFFVCASQFLIPFHSLWSHHNAYFMRQLNQM